MRDLDDVFERLKGSAFRRRFRLGKVEAEYLRVKGADAVVEHAANFVDKRLSPANPDKDGKQTPFRGHPVFIAQHATATCCRGCIEKWHGIPRGQPLTGAEVAHLVSAITRWLRQQTTDETGPATQHELWG